MVMAPNPVTIDVAVRITTMDDIFLKDSESPLCKTAITAQHCDSDLQHVTVDAAVSITIVDNIFLSDSEIPLCITPHQLTSRIV